MQSMEPPLQLQIQAKRTSFYENAQYVDKPLIQDTLHADQDALKGEHNIYKWQLIGETRSR